MALYLSRPPWLEPVGCVLDGRLAVLRYSLAVNRGGLSVMESSDSFLELGTDYRS